MRRGARHGQDFTGRLAQGFTGLIQSNITPPSFPWPNPHNSKLFDLEFPSQSFGTRDFGLVTHDSSGINGVSAIFDIGNRIGQAGVDFSAGLNGLVQQFFRSLPVPFQHEDNVGVGATAVQLDAEGSCRLRSDLGVATQGDLAVEGFYNLFTNVLRKKERECCLLRFLEFFFFEIKLDPNFVCFMFLLTEMGEVGYGC
jgi:hypothetical protein